MSCLIATWLPRHKGILSSSIRSREAAKLVINSSSFFSFLLARTARGFCPVKR